MDAIKDYVLPPGSALALKVVYSDGQFEYSDAPFEFLWSLTLGGETVAPDWDPKPECGGGLHVWGWSRGDLRLSQIWSFSDVVWLAVEYESYKAVDLGGCVKAPSCRTVAVSPNRKEIASFIRQYAPGNVGGFLFDVVESSGEVIVGDGGVVRVGDKGRAVAGYWGCAVAGKDGIAVAGIGGTAKAGHRGTAEVGDYGIAEAGDWGTATAGIAGDVRVGVGGKAKVGKCGRIHLSTESATVTLRPYYDDIQPDVFYTIEPGTLKAVEWLPPGSDLETRIALDRARMVAAEHKKADPQIVAAKYFPGGNEIRLIMVISGIQPEDSLSVFRMKCPGFPLLCAIITPEEWEAIEEGSYALPTGWDLSNVITL